MMLTANALLTSRDVSLRHELLPGPDQASFGALVHSNVNTIVRTTIEQNKIVFV
jgi:hypothetical protein